MLRIKYDLTNAKDPIKSGQFLFPAAAYLETVIITALQENNSFTLYSCICIFRKLEIKMSQQLNSSSNRGTNSFPGESFLDSFAQFLENIKRETKDIFELLSYPCVYQNPKKKIGVNDIPILKKSFALNIVSIKDKVHVETFVEKKKELFRILENVKNYNTKYKLDISLVSVLENMIMLHLFNEYKIHNIVSTLQEHNFSAPLLNSDLPKTLIPHIELQSGDGSSVLRETPTDLSVNDHRLMSILKFGNVDVRISNMDWRKKETVLIDAVKNYNFENSNASDNSNAAIPQLKGNTLEKNMEREQIDCSVMNMRKTVEKNVEKQKELNMERWREVERIHDKQLEKQREINKHRDIRMERHEGRESPLERTTLVSMDQSYGREEKKIEMVTEMKRVSLQKGAKEEGSKEQEGTAVAEGSKIEREAIEDIGLSPDTLLLLNLLPKKRKHRETPSTKTRVLDTYTNVSVLPFYKKK